MNGTEIFAPVMAMILLTLLVWLYLFARRVPFITSLDIPADELTAAKLAELSPPEVVNPSDNLKNLFEIPTLFYVLCITLYVTQQVDSIYLGAAWIFVAFRYLHSLMHCTRNIVTVRFVLYLLSCLALWFMFLRAGLNFIQG